MMTIGSKLSVPPWALAIVSFVACGDAAKRPLGAACATDAECEIGECIAQVCLDPSGDEDLDRLENRLEAALGSSPLVRDSDGDGVDDGDEVGVDLANPADEDGDGRIDAIESAADDGDRDCIVDQSDADDATAEADPTVLARFVCKTAGACGAAGARVSATCVAGVPGCDYAAVPGYAEVEARCDGVDDDCDGLTDERFSAGGEVTFDGGPSPADAGRALGETCGTGACANGVVVCAPDGASLACSTADRAGALACDADMDCDGVPDEAEVSSPLAQTLAGCTEHYADADHDGAGAGAGRCLCAPYGDYVVTNRDDCAETDPARYPLAPAICGVDADCDGAAQDVGEACDDGDDDPDDGCHACRAVARWVAAPPSFYTVTGLAGGGFVVASGGGGAGLGRARAQLFDARGAPVATIGDGDFPPESSYAAGAVSLAALSGGGFALGTWAEPTVAGWRFMVQSFDATGVALGPAVQAWQAREPFAGIGLAEVGADIAVVIAEGTIELRLVSPDGQLLRAAGSARVTDAYDVEVVGLGDRLAVKWSRYDSDTFATHVELERFGPDLQAIGEVLAIDAGPDEIAATRLARHDDGVAVFVLGRRESFTTVGYVTIDAAGATMGPIYLEQEDADGCPYALLGGFDAAGYAWAAVADGECRSELRAWYAGASILRLDPFDEALHPGAAVYDVVGAPVGPGFVLVFEVGDQAARPGLYLMRYGAGAQGAYLPDASL